MDIGSNKDNIAVVVINHKSEMEDSEKLSFHQCLMVLGRSHDIFLMLPSSVSEDEYKAISKTCSKEYILIKEDDEHLSSYENYNYFLKTPQFYEHFKDYDYLLIYQTDCFVFSDKLQYFAKMGYTYYGAPLSYKEDISNDLVGNGGLSLRKVDYFIDVCKNIPNEIMEDSKYVAEDLFFCNYYNIENICPLEVAEKFSWEYACREHYEKNNHELPMGCHAFMKNYKFWREFINTDKKDFALFLGISRNFRGFMIKDLLSPLHPSENDAFLAAFRIATGNHAHLSVYGPFFGHYTNKDANIDYYDWRDFYKDSKEKYFNVLITNGRLYDYVLNANCRDIYAIINTDKVIGMENADKVDKFITEDEFYIKYDLGKYNKKIFSLNDIIGRNKA